MKRYNGVVIDMNGEPVGDASITVNDAVSGLAATIYSDDGVTTKTNPTLSDGYGRFFFYAANGNYNLVISGSGITTYTLSDISLQDLYNEEVTFAEDKMITDYGSQPGLGAEASEKNFINIDVDSTGYGMTTKAEIMIPVRASIYMKTAGVASAFCGYTVLDAAAETAVETCCFHGVAQGHDAGAGADPLIATADWWLNIDEDMAGIAQLITVNSKVAVPAQYKGFIFCKQDDNVAYNGPLTRAFWLRCNPTEGYIWVENKASKLIMALRSDDTTDYDNTEMRIYSGDDSDRYLSIYVQDDVDGNVLLTANRKAGDTGGDVVINFAAGGDFIYGGGTSDTIWKVDTSGVLWVYDTVLKAVTFGIDDSGGAGFKLLRVVN